MTQVTHRTLPPLALCRHVTLKDNSVTTLCTPWTTPSVTVAKNLYAHTLIHLRMLTVQVFRGVNFKHFETSVGHIG